MPLYCGRTVSGLNLGCTSTAMQAGPYQEKRRIRPLTYLAREGAMSVRRVGREQLERLRSEGLFSGNVTAGLETLRRKLLDLSTRNKLLGFRHPKRSSLRVVDELPDCIFSSLLDGSSLSFKPVAKPTKEEKQRLAGQIDPAHEPTAAEVARLRGVAAEFDLPVMRPGGPAAQRASHRDDQLQTLLFPEDLNATLEILYRAARVSIEERGINILYVAFGFLEWSEQQDSDQRHYAPLILVPVVLERRGIDRSTGFRQYMLAHSGEDVGDNLSLREKLKQEFGLVLPTPLDENEAERAMEPEQYFAALRGILDTKQNWKLRRWATLGCFEFSKLLMYRDLDSTAWPPGRRLNEHKLIKPFFEAIDAAEVTSGEVYSDLDAADKAVKIPLIFDADSSQHSVLSDAIEGRSLIVQGPPGTGKSQTITNLVAAALSSGKTVLFVSEKLAALEVVRRRLDGAGLGEFCLELHSHKAQKRAFLDDLSRRVRLRGHFLAPGRLESALEKLESERKRLANYSFLVAQPWGAIGWPIRNLMAAAVAYQRRLSFPITTIEQCVVTDAKSISEAALDQGAAEIRRFAEAHRSLVASFGSWQNHPLYGLDNHELSFVQLNGVLVARRKMQMNFEAVKHEAARLEEIAGAELSLVLREWSECAAEATRWPRIGRPLPAYFSKLRDVGLRGDLRRFAEELEHYRKSLDALGKIVNANAALAETRRRPALALLADATRLGLGTATRESVGMIGKTCARFAALARICSHDLKRLCGVLSIPLPSNAAALATLLRVQKLALATPWDQLAFRSGALKRPSFRTVLDQYEQEAEAVLACKQSLGERFVLAALPAKTQIAELLLVVRSAGPLRILDARWRATNRTLRGMSRSGARRKPRDWMADLEALLAYLDQCQTIERNPRYREVFGPAFGGLETNIAGLKRLIAWCADAQTELAGKLEAGAPAADYFLDFDEGQLHLLAASAANYPQEFAAFRECLELFEELGRSPLKDRCAAEPDLERMSDMAGQAAKNIEALDSVWDAFGASTTRTVSELNEALGLAEQTAVFAEYLASSPSIAGALGKDFRGAEMDPGELRAVLDLVEALLATKVPAAVRDSIFANPSTESIEVVGQILAALAQALTAFEKATTEFRVLIAPRRSQWPGRPFVEQPLAAIGALLGSIPASAGEFDDVIDFVRKAKKLSDDGLEPIVAGLYSAKVTEKEIEDAYRYVIHKAMADAIFEEKTELARFRGVDHDEARTRFIDLDRSIIDLQRALVANRADSRPVPDGIAGGRAAELSELALIRREIAKQQRHIPIRQLLRRAGRALLGLKPCFMMSPLSVAQYLQPGKIEFDLVVMDEASQIRPEEALGAIARAQQMVIVGDSRQLPPTSFFERAHLDEIEDEETANIAEESESILEAAVSVFRQRQLTWHYRSQHESLIAFSNEHFYDRELAVFPSAYDKHPDFGIRWQFVADGLFQGRRNPAEAEIVASAAIRHMETGRSESLGVVAMNIDQAELIESLIDAKAATSPVAEEWLRQRGRGSEPFFVKNLENVQGDERDVILISFTYGRGAAGPPDQNFGPINRGYGWRRLNVLYTRARKRVVVIASMRSDHVAVEGRNPRALRALGEYLGYAESGRLVTAAETGRPPESHFEEAVIRALTQRGYKCVPQVGVSNYRIDVAVCHPDRPGEYLIGIECDGAPYHSGKSVRDRDRIRQQILEGLGWRIGRIWSTDWYRDSDRQIGRIDKFIRDALEADQRQRRERKETIAQLQETKKSTTPTAAAVATGSLPQRPPKPGLSIDEAREELIRLRELDIKQRFANADPAKGLLRKSMLDKLLSVRPRTPEAFRATIPLYLRDSTDSRQVAEYLEKVLEILSEIRE